MTSAGHSLRPSSRRRAAVGSTTNLVRVGGRVKVRVRARVRARARVRWLDHGPPLEL